MCLFDEQAKVDTPPAAAFTGPKPTMAATAQPAKTATPPLTGIGETPFCHRSKSKPHNKSQTNPKQSQT